MPRILVSRSQRVYHSPRHQSVLLGAGLRSHDIGRKVCGLFLWQFLTWRGLELHLEVARPAALDITVAVSVIGFGDLSWGRNFALFYWPNQHLLVVFAHDLIDRLLRVGAPLTLELPAAIDVAYVQEVLRFGDNTVAYPSFYFGLLNKFALARELHRKGLSGAAALNVLRRIYTYVNFDRIPDELGHFRWHLMSHR